MRPEWSHAKEAAGMSSPEARHGWRPGPGHSDGGDKKGGERNKRPGESPGSGAEIRKGGSREPGQSGGGQGWQSTARAGSHLSTTGGL